MPEGGPPGFMVEIIPMEARHIDRVYEIELDCFSTPWSRKSFRDELANPTALYLIAVDGEEVLGYAGMWHVINEGHITNVAVRHGNRRQGVGEKLIRGLVGLALKKEMIGLTLEVSMSNAGAQKLYSKLGFKPEGIRKRYYDTGDDAIIMWKILN
jgi:ribosomal-protein-alanine N-acetyltransferase